MDVLGVIIERVSGLSLSKFFETNLFESLGMKDTHFYISPKENAIVIILAQKTPFSKKLVDGLRPIINMGL